MSNLSLCPAGTVNPLAGVKLFLPPGVPCGRFVQRPRLEHLLGFRSERVELVGVGWRLERPSGLTS